MSPLGILVLSALLGLVKDQDLNNAIRLRCSPMMHHFIGGLAVEDCAFSACVAGRLKAELRHRTQTGLIEAKEGGTVTGEGSNKLSPIMMPTIGRLKDKEMFQLMRSARGLRAAWQASGNGPWLIVALVAAVLAVIAQANGLAGKFVLDDIPFLVDNPQLSESHDLSYFFTKDVWSYSAEPVASPLYRPFYFAILWLINDMWPGSSLALHLFSLFLHIVATLLVLALIPRLLPGVSPLAAGTGAFLFAVHPVHAEAVAWISAFVHPMATALILGSYLLHDRHRRTAGLPALAAAGLLYVAALLTSEMAAAYPLLIVALDWIYRGRPSPLRAAPYFLILAFYIAVRRIVLGESIPLSLSDPEAWLRFPLFLVEYLRHLVLPWPQPLYIAVPADNTVSLTSWAAAASLAVIFVVFLIQGGENRRPATAAAAWICISLLPPLAAAFNPTPFIALRALYLPSVGIAILVAWIVAVSSIVRQRTGLVAAALVGILMLSLVLSMAANRGWLDDQRVYSRVTTFNPRHYGGYLGLARYYERAGQIQGAITQYEQAAALLGPEQRVELLLDLGFLVAQTGNYSRSLEIYTQITKLQPNLSSAWVGVGNNFWYLGQFSEAADAYRMARVADPGNREACHNLVLVLRKMGKAEEAARQAGCAAIP